MSRHSPTTRPYSQQPGTRELRDTYVEKCKDFVCDPVKPLVGAINAALSVDGELSFIKLNGNSKELFSRRLEYMQVNAKLSTLNPRPCEALHS
jgi:hypothetical protein